MSRVAVLALLLVSLCSQVGAQEWARKMLDTSEHDFGTVARGSDTEFRFPIKNIYKEDVHLSSVRSSCGCTSPSLENDTIKTYDTGYVVAKFNTRTYTGYHSATLTVTIDKPFPAQLQVRVRGNIRGDVSFEPGGIDFGKVDQGTTSDQSVRLSYIGRSTWQIVDVVAGNSSSEKYAVRLGEPQRNGGRVSYDVFVTLRDTAPAGYFSEQLVLVTNDSSNPRIPLDVQGEVVAELTVPANLALGEVQQGDKISKKLVVRGRKPFLVTAVKCEDKCFSFKSGEEPKTTQIVDVNFAAECAPGTVKVPVVIETSLGESYRAECVLLATVAEPAAKPEVLEASGEETAVPAEGTGVELVGGR